MTLNKLQQDMYTAMKEGDHIHKEVLSSLIAAVKKVAIDKKCKDNIPESLIDEVIRKEYKTIQEQIDTCPEDREDMLLEFKNKLIVLDMYVTKLISDEEEILKLVTDLCKELTFTSNNKGIIMKKVSTELKGKVDMKVTMSIVNKLIK